MDSGRSGPPPGGYELVMGQTLPDPHGRKSKPYCVADPAQQGSESERPILAKLAGERGRKCSTA